jgi:tetratricopeptide (TPR) repeat protein
MLGNPAAAAHHSDLSLEKVAVELCLSDGPDGFERGNQLLSCLVAQWESTSKLEILEESIEISKEMLAIPFIDHISRLSLCKTRILLLQTHTEQMGISSFAEELVSLHREIFDSYPSGHHDRISTGLDLSEALCELYEETGDLLRLDECASLLNDMLTGSPTMSERIRCMQILAWSKDTYFGHTVDGDDKLDEAIRTRQDMLSLQPADTIERAITERQVASSLLRRYEKEKDTDLLQDISSLLKRALRILPLPHPSRERARTDFIWTLLTLWELTTDAKLLMELKELQYEAVIMSTTEGSDLVELIVDLMGTLRSRLAATDNDDTFVEALGTGSEALAEVLEYIEAAIGFMPSELAVHLRFQSSCAQVLMLRFLRGGDTSHLDKPLRLYREVWAACPANGPDRFSFCRFAAMALNCAYEAKSWKPFREEALQYGQEALRLARATGISLPTALLEYASILESIARLTGDHDVMNEMLTLEKEALTSPCLVGADRAVAYSDHANTYSMIYRKTGDLSLLEIAIGLHRKALDGLPLTHVNRFRVRADFALATALYSVPNRDETRCNEAIRILRQDLSIQPVGHQRRPTTCMHLATALRSRHSILETNSWELMQEIVNLERETVSLIPPGHYNRSAGCARLASSLHQMFEDTGDIACLDEAIVLAKEARSLTSADSPSRVNLCLWLPILLYARHQCSGVGTSPTVPESDSFIEEALDLCPPGHPRRFLALAMKSRWNIVDPDKMGTSLRLLNESLRTTSIHDVTTMFPEAARILGTASAMQIPSEAMPLLLESYDMVLDMASRLAGFALTRSAQLYHISVCRTLGPDAYRIACSMSKPQIALQLLERARGIVWSQLMHLRDSKASGGSASTPLEEELQNLLRKLATGDNVEVTMYPGQLHSFQLRGTSARHHWNTRAQQVIQEVRAQPAMQDFMKGLSIESLLSTASTHPVVIVVAAREECHALVIGSSADALLPLRLTGMSAEHLCRMLVRIHNRHSNFRGEASKDHGGDEEEDATESDIDESYSDGERLGLKSVRAPRIGLPQLLKTLWMGVVKPVLEALSLTVSQVSVRREVYANSLSHRRPPEARDHEFTGALQASSRLRLFMRLAFMRELAKNVAQTMSCRLTHRH